MRLPWEPYFTNWPNMSMFQSIGAAREVRGRVLMEWPMSERPGPPLSLFCLLSFEVSTNQTACNHWQYGTSEGRFQVRDFSANATCGPIFLWELDLTVFVLFFFLFFFFLILSLLPFFLKNVKQKQTDIFFSLRKPCSSSGLDSWKISLSYELAFRVWVNKHKNIFLCHMTKFRKHVAGSPTLFHFCVFGISACFMPFWMPFRFWPNWNAVPRKSDHADLLSAPSCGWSKNNTMRPSILFFLVGFLFGLINGVKRSNTSFLQKQIAWKVNLH